MKEINKKDTAILLSYLDSNIEIKCNELKAKEEERKIKKIFFLSCSLIMLFFILQFIFKIFNLNFLITFVMYQVIALIALIQFISNMNRGGITNGSYR